LRKQNTESEITVRNECSSSQTTRHGQYVSPSEAIKVPPIEID
jgi:hypothetical protein